MQHEDIKCACDENKRKCYEKCYALLHETKYGIKYVR